MSAVTTRGQNSWFPMTSLDPVDVYRDDGPLARGLGRAIGPLVPVRAPALLLAALLPMLAAAVVSGGDVSLPVAGAVVAWAVLLGGTARGRPARRKQRWMEPPLTRAVEFTGMIWLAALEGPEAYPAAFALLAALAYRHYDVVYRLRAAGMTPAPWVNAISGGWDGRLIVLYLMLLSGEFRLGVFVAAAVLGVAFVSESVISWRRAEGHGLVVEEHEDEEGEVT
jgi:hypothetical protein